MTSFDDGSTLSRGATGELLATGGAAAVVLACARNAVELPAAQALAWYRGDASAATHAVRRLTTSSVEVSAGGEKASVSLRQWLDAMAAAWEVALEDESTWLLRPEPLACVPSAGDLQFAQALEARVASLDEAVRTNALSDVAASARRSAVLAELRAAALLDEPLLAHKAEVLDARGFPRLARCARAALALTEYYASPERELELKEQPSTKLHDGALSLDWVEAAAVPPAGFTRFGWWAACERALRGADPGDGARGSVFLLQGRIAAQLSWRLEDGRRMTLYGLSMRARR
ncbi:MAG: hypothetical protein AMXMBFR34_08140 [Myxococcaceae bacterium]